MRAGRDWLSALVPELLSLIRRKKLGGPRGSGAAVPNITPCKGPEEAPEIQVEFERPIDQTSIWKPSKHASLESYLKSVDQLKDGYDITRATARFDIGHKSITINTTDDLKTFLSLRSRGPLFITVPSVTEWPCDMARSFENLAQYSVGVGRKVMKRFMLWVNDAEVDQRTIAEQESLLKGIVRCEEFKAFGDVDQYEGVSMAKWGELIKTLEIDSLPPKVINGLKRASMMGKLSETCFDLDYKDGKLKNAFLVRLLTMKIGEDQMNAVIFHYQLRFVSAADGQDGVRLALSPEQALAIERFVDKAALLKWQEKLQISDAEDADVF